jgi:hypothetical protein
MPLRCGHFGVPEARSVPNTHSKIHRDSWVDDDECEAKADLRHAQQSRNCQPESAPARWLAWCGTLCRRDRLNAVPANIDDLAAGFVYQPFRRPPVSTTGGVQEGSRRARTCSLASSTEPAAGWQAVATKAAG